MLIVSLRFYLKRPFFAFLLKWQSYVSLSLVIIIHNYEKFVWQFLHVRSYHSSTKATVAWWSQKSQKFYEVTLMWQLFCQNDNLSLSLTWLDCLQIDSGGFILFAEINQILLKIYFIPIILTFYVSSMYLVALYQESEL